MDLENLEVPADIVYLLDSLAGEFGITREHLGFIYTNPGQRFVPHDAEDTWDSMIAARLGNPDIVNASASEANRAVA